MRYTGWHRGRFGASNFACGLAQCNLPDSILGNLKTYINWQKKSCQGCHEGAFGCLTCYSNLLLISCRVHKGTFLQKTKKDSSNSIPPLHLPLSSLHMLCHFTVLDKIWKRMEATLFYTELHIYYRTKHLAISSLILFCGWQKQVIDWATLHCTCKVASVN